MVLQTSRARVTDYVETGEDNMHPIRHIGNVPFDKESKQTYIKNVLHVPTIMKNLVFVGQIVEQCMQVRLYQGGCFIEKEGLLIARKLLSVGQKSKIGNIRPIVGRK